MRITTPQITAMMHGSMNTNSARIGKLMQQMATGDRMLVPSDDPIASVRVLRIQREEASLAQYRDNIANLTSSLSKQEANLKAASETMLRVQDLLLWAANLGANATDDLVAIGSELETLKETILSFANVRDEEGRYLFSGTMTNQPAITFDTSDPDPTQHRYVISGNNEYRKAAVANGVLLEENVTATQVFGPSVDMLNTLHELVTTLQDPAFDVNDPAVGTQITDALNALDRTYRDLQGALTDLGGRHNSLSLLTDTNADFSLVNQKIEGELTALDYASASIDLNNYLLALNATQKTYVKINDLSLFNQL